MFRVDGEPIRVKQYAFSEISGICCVDGCHLRMDSFAAYLFRRRNRSLEFPGLGVCHKRLQILRYSVLVERPFL